MNLDLQRVALDPLANAPAWDQHDASLVAGTQARYLEAVLSGSGAAALEVVGQALRDGITVVDLYVDVLQVTRPEVGRLWETNRITVARACGGWGVISRSWVSAR